MCRGSKDNIGDEDKSVIELRKSFKFKNHTKKIPYLDAKNGKIEIDSKNPKQVKWFEETNQLPQSTILDCGLFIENHSFCISFFYRSKWKNNPSVINEYRQKQRTLVPFSRMLLHSMREPPMEHMDFLDFPLQSENN